MVISGGHFKPEALKPKEVVSLLLDDAELECKCKFVNEIHVKHTTRAQLSVALFCLCFETSRRAKPFT